MKVAKVGVGKWAAIGDTTFASDPQKSHKSYPVITGATGKRFYVLVSAPARENWKKAEAPTGWYFAVPVYPHGFKITRRVPRGKVPAGLAQWYISQRLPI